MIVLPDHLQALWTLPAGDADFAKRWMLIKAGFSRQIPPTERRSPSRVAKGEARYLAAPLLGASDSGRRRLRAPCGLHPFQSRQAWVGHTGGRVAVFVDSPLCSARLAVRRVGVG